MKVTVVKDYHEMSETAARIMADLIKAKPDSYLCLPTGGSVKGTYEKLCELAKCEQISFVNTTGYNMDEYATLGKDNPNGYYYFMKEHLYSKVDINLDNTHSPEAEVTDLQAACVRYTEKIAGLGAFDFTLLGIGSDGHIAFNMPSSALYMDTHIEDLTDDTIKANSRFFVNINQVPKQAMTIGVGTIMKSKKIVLVASGKAKAKVVGKWLNNRMIDPMLPASVLWMHPDATVILDEDAASEVK